MTNPSQIEWVHLDDPTAVSIGDIVSAEAGGLPLYRVMALAEGAAELSDEMDRRWVLPLVGFQWKAAQI